MRHRNKLLLMCVLALTILPAAVGCQRSPVTGESRLNLLSPQQEVELGREAAPQVVEELGGLYNNAEVRSYVQQVGQRVAAPARNPELPYEYSFDVIDNDMVNAFALPGGPIYVTRGLLANLENEAQLAAVLAHEVTHVAGQHSAAAISRQMVTSLGLEAAVAALTRTRGETVGRGVGQIGQIAAGLQQMSYSREHEREADNYGLRYLVAAGYQPRAMVEVMRMFERQEGGGGTPEFLRTHPNPGNRVEYLEQTIRENYSRAANDPNMMVGRERYQQQVLGRL